MSMTLKKLILLVTEKKSKGFSSMTKALQNHDIFVKQIKAGTRAQNRVNYFEGTGSKWTLLKESKPSGLGRAHTGHDTQT